MVTKTISSLFLAGTVEITVIAVLAVAVVAVGVLCFFLGRRMYKNATDKKLGEVNQRISKMLEDAEGECKALKKEAILEAKEQDLKLRNEFERDTKEKKNELQKLEQRLIQKEDNLDKKEDALQKKNDALDQQQKNLVRQEGEVKKMQEKINHQHDLMIQELEKVAQLTKDEAKRLLTENIMDETRHDVALQVRNIEQQAKDEADTNAKKIISLAIQKCASDHASEITVSVVPLPNDDMKARIIGREGRNIRALETATGVDLIIDDTPEAITLSSFDQTRREVARMTLERLIGDGRIHPARIEETVEKCRHDLELQMKREGERAVMELGIHGLHPDLIKLIGRLKYRTSFGQNALTHSMEVAWLAGLLAGEMGVNVTLARRAGLLHDIGKALDHEIEGSHVQIGVDICRKYKENTQVIHAIEAHHGDVEPKTPLAFIIQACDAISAARPGARRENVESYVKRLENLEEISSSFEGVEQAFAVQAGREVRIMVKPDVISDDQVILLARSIAKKIEDTLDYPGQIKVNVIRESRAVEYAK
mgnify:CR=1 FL=1